MKKESQNIVEAWGQPMTEYIADPGCLRLLFYALPAATEMLIDEDGKKSGMKNELSFFVGNRRYVISEESTICRVYLSLMNDPYKSITAISINLKISRSTIQKHIETLKNYGIITRVGPDKGGHWECIETESDSMKGGEQ